jgi:hypothetical protein
MAKSLTQSTPVEVTTVPTKTVAAPATPAPGKEFYLGGYDAKSCPTLVMKNHLPFFGPEDQDPFLPGDIARMEAGVVFEPQVGQAWEEALGARFFAVPACDRSEKSKRSRERITLATMKDPGDVLVIWNARLPKLKKSHQTGEPDALVHWGIGPDGTHLWVPVDVKHHKSLEGSAKNEGFPLSEFSDPHPDAARIADLGSGSLRWSDALQLAHYHRMLEKLGHAAPVPFGGIIGKELKVLWYRLDEKIFDRRKTSALSVYDEEFARRVEIAKHALDGVAIAPPEWKQECEACVWRTSCHDQLKFELDHITLISGVTPLVAAKHYQVGVRRASELTRFDWRTARLVDAKVDVPALMAWASTVTPETVVTSGPVHAKVLESGLLATVGVTTAADVLTLDSATAAYSATGVGNLADSIDRARAAKVGKVFLNRGVSSVSVNRSVYEQDVDIEDSQGYVYLIGVRTTGRKRDTGRTATERLREKERFEYDAFVNWDKSAAGECRVFTEFWAHIQACREKAKRRQFAYRLYYYTSHEVTAFKALAERHAGQPGVPTVTEVEEFFALKEVIDLHKVLSTELVWPTASIRLKEVAKWVRFSWRDSDPGGGNSLAWYDAAVDHPDESVREDNRVRLLEYNEDDVTAQVALRDWLSRLGEARHPGKKLPSIATLDRRFSRR